MSLWDDIINSDDIEIEPVSVEEWDKVKEGTLFMKALSAGDKSEIERASTVIKKDKKGNLDMDINADEIFNAKARAVLMSLCDKDGKRIKEKVTSEDIAEFVTKSSAVISRLYEVANRLSRIDIDKDETVKN